MELELNRPLARTYGWLRVNGTRIEAAVSSDASIDEEIPEGVNASWEEDLGGFCLSDIKTGSGADAVKLFDGRGARVYRVGQGVKAGGVLRIKEDFDKDEAGRAICFILEDGSELTAVVEFSGGRGTASALTLISVGKNAVLRLAEVQRMNDDTLFINDNGGKTEDSGRIEWTRVVLGGKETYDGLSVALEGDNSSLDVRTGYRLGGSQKLDMNYEAVHTGKKTNCEMKAAGVLSDDAFKLLRGTIDLRQGCKGAVGNESEDVLLMDDTVRNQTIPVILCGEEDVVGNHGATIGRLDEQLIHYIESRGIDRDSAYEMMARAKVDAVIRTIPDEKTVEELLPEEAV